MKNKRKLFAVVLLVSCLAAVALISIGRPNKLFHDPGFMKYVRVLREQSIRRHIRVHGDWQNDARIRSTSAEHLSSPLSIKGRVLLSTGEPASRADVTLQRVGIVEEPYVETQSDDFGYFSFGVIDRYSDDPEYLLVARLEDASGSAIVSRSAHTGEDYNVWLGACGEQIAFEVVDTSGAAIANAVIYEYLGGYPVSAYSSDARGIAQVCSSGGRTWTLTADGYAAAHVWGRSASNRRRIVLVQGGQLAGEVVDASGHVVPSAVVEIVGSSEFGSPRVVPLQTVSTDELGRFRAVNLASGYYLVKARSTTHVPDPEYRYVKVGINEVTAVQLVVRRCRKIDGSVVSGGRPVAGVVVAVSPSRRSVRTDRNGHFALCEINEALEVEVRDAPSARFTIPAGHQDIRGLTITVHDSLVRLVGRVMRGSTPMPGVSVRAKSLDPRRQRSEYASVTNSSGDFVMDAMPAGEVEIFAYHRHTFSPRVRVNMASGAVPRVDLELPSLVEVSGSVSFADSEASAMSRICFVPVGVSDIAERVDGQLCTVVSASGRLFAVQLPRGKYSCVASEFQDTNLGTIDISDGIPRTDVNLVLAPAGAISHARLHGKVVRADGTPLVAEIALRDGRVEVSRTDGRFEFVGDVQHGALLTGRSLDGLVGSLLSRSDGANVLVLQEPGAITGSVRNVESRCSASPLVYANSAKRRRSALVSPLGSYSILDLEAGKYSVYLYCPSSGARVGGQVEVDVTSGSPVELSL